MKKKLGLLIVRSNYREIDWILPLIYRIKHKYKLITFFQNKEILSKFSKENKTLYNKWKKINTFYFFPTIQHLLIIKILKFFTFNIKILTNYLNEFSRKRLYSEKFLYKKLSSNKLGDHKVEILFHEIAKNTAWINTFQNKPDIKIIRYPDATTPRKNYKIDKCKKKIPPIQNHFVLASNKHDHADYLNYFNKKNILTIGYPRYQKDWINSFKTIKLNNKKKIFLVGCKQYKHHQSESIKVQIKSIMNITKKIKNSLTIFKPHPAQDMEELKLFLSEYDKKIWKITNEHVFNFKNITQIFIGFHRSSSVLDALAVNIPCIKLWSWKAWDKKDFNEQRYLKRYGAHNSILTELKLTKLVSNENELKQIILSNKQFKNKLLKKQKKNFMKLNIYNKRMNIVLKKILK
jgi:hypothetical protein